MLGKSSSELPVSDIMTPQSKLMTVSPQQSVVDVMTLMTDNNFRHVPVARLTDPHTWFCSSASNTSLHFCNLCTLELVNSRDAAENVIACIFEYSNVARGFSELQKQLASFCSAMRNRSGTAHHDVTWSSLCTQVDHGNYLGMISIRDVVCRPP